MGRSLDDRTTSSAIINGKSPESVDQLLDQCGCIRLKTSTAAQHTPKHTAEPIPNPQNADLIRCNRLLGDLRVQDVQATRPGLCSRRAGVVRRIQRLQTFGRPLQMKCKMR